LFGELRDLLVGSLPELLVLLLLTRSVFLGIAEFSPGFVEFEAELFIGPLLFLALKVGLSPGAIEFILLGVELTLKCVEVVGELVDSTVVGFAVSLKRVGQRVDPPVQFLDLASVLVLLLVKFVLEGINLSSESQFPLFLLYLLVLLVSEQILYLVVFIFEQPVQVVDLVDQSFDFVLVAGDQLGCVSPLQIFVFDLDIHDLGSVEFFQF
jgi:hypothetical protein